ncbi:hypothetical protein [Helicobacter bilis]|uniref:hypothetical protein n=1 Tax=Helicobacter bilis TaxID=37372 RepID=UPI002942A243|nr:hypothetical protein [Helicobacter bilis]
MQSKSWRSIYRLCCHINVSVSLCLSVFSRHILGFRICVMLSGSKTSLLDSVLSQFHATLETQNCIITLSKP